jgi:hypothetical protein
MKIYENIPTRRVKYFPAPCVIMSALQIEVISRIDKHPRQGWRILARQYPKYLGCIAYPYMNGTLYAGDGFTASKVGCFAYPYMNGTLHAGHDSAVCSAGLASNSLERGRS